jgi:hypothetical protein
LQLTLNWQALHKPTLVRGQHNNPAFEQTINFLEYSKKEFYTEQRIKELEQKRKLHTARTPLMVYDTVGKAVHQTVIDKVQQSKVKR